MFQWYTVPTNMIRKCLVLVSLGLKKLKKTITLKTLAIRYFVNFNAAIGKTKDISNHI